MAKKPPNMTELTTYVDKDLKLRFKLACTGMERSMSDVVVELIEDWLDNLENIKSAASDQNALPRRDKGVA